MNVGCLDYLINKHQVLDKWYLNGNWDSDSVSLEGVLADGQDFTWWRWEPGEGMQTRIANISENTKENISSLV